MARRKPTDPNAVALERALESRDMRSVAPVVQELVRSRDGAQLVEQHLGASAFRFGAELRDSRLDDRGAELIAHELMHVVQQKG